MASGHPPYGLAALARVREMTNIGIVWHPGDDGQIPCGERASAGASLYRSGDADRRTRGEVVVHSRSLIDRASGPF